MSPKRSRRNSGGRKNDVSDPRRIALGVTYHKKDIPWIVWAVTRINERIRPVHVELTMRGDSRTRITVSVDALTSRRYFSRCGGGNASIFPPIGTDAPTLLKWHR